MLCNILSSFLPNSSRNRKKRSKRKDEVHLRPPSVAFGGDPFDIRPARFSLRSEKINGRNARMVNKATNFTDLIQRVAASCLLHPLAAGRRDPGEIPAEYASDCYDGDGGGQEDDEKFDFPDGEDDGDRAESLRVWGQTQPEARLEMVVQMELIMGEVFDAVSAMKKAYVSLQEAHSPWDPERMRLADAAVVAELRRVGLLRERFRRSSVLLGGGGERRRRYGTAAAAAATVRELVAPYEAVVAELKREVKARDVEVENLKEKLNKLTSPSFGGRKSRFQSRRKVSCSSQGQVASSPAPDLFEAAMSMVKEASKSFTALLLSLMRSAHWDIAAAVRSIEAATATSPEADAASIAAGTHHAKYAVESYLCRKIFQGFDHETFYMDGSLSSLLHPDQFRRDCFSQYRDMKAMDPAELLGVLPTCHFGKFCAKKFLAIVHPKMEESLFGDLAQRRQVLAGTHPRTQFYGQFLAMAKAVWLLHLLAFSFDPPPSQFEASRGAEFHPQYMESVVRYAGAGHVVGFPVSPGFKLANGSVVKARVYLVSRA